MLIDVIKQEIHRLVEEQENVDWLLDTLELVGGNPVEIVKEYTKSS